MSSATRRHAQSRYVEARHAAFQATSLTLGGCTRAPFFLAEIDRRAEDVWRADWAPVNDRQPLEGGWDWPAVWQTFRSQIGRFDVAVWCGKRLCGLAIGTLGSNAVTIEAVEGSPASWRCAEWGMA